MNRTAVRNLVIAHTRRSDRASDINTAIDMALTEISQISEFRLTRITADVNLPVDGQRVTLPTDCFQVVSVRLMDADETLLSTELELLDRLVIEKSYPNLASDVTSQPVACFVDDQSGELVVVPPTSAQWTLRISYQRLFPEITDDASLISRQIANAVVSWATAYIFRSTQQYPDAAQWSQEYQKALTLAIRADKRSSSHRKMEGFSQRQEAVGSAQGYLDPFDNGDGTSHD